MGISKLLKTTLLVATLLSPLSAEETSAELSSCDTVYNKCVDACENAKGSYEKCSDNCDEKYEKCNESSDSKKKELD